METEEHWILDLINLVKLWMSVSSFACKKSANGLALDNQVEHVAERRMAVRQQQKLSRVGILIAQQGICLKVAIRAVMEKMQQMTPNVLL